ncbi:hypothetical protein OPV22_028679 [Ensete ventricosum]|uniref:Uncharacterized protein n=1 Tax=Ensete ventricosum TaxID=4639 RepID=A0AAV8P4A4_ENSVE|nr:hypothetical protein OPV22_028679 [Ensete ventricosum]
MANGILGYIWDFCSSQPCERVSSETGRRARPFFGRRATPVLKFRTYSWILMREVDFPLSAWMAVVFLYPNLPSYLIPEGHNKACTVFAWTFVNIISSGKLALKLLKLDEMYIISLNCGEYC